ncbi:hypothetical protein KR52_14265 [Synechococcus sp. KORDI-52]|nr:hypothetical protein KR52_14265 [Synechococcus sp. KORDI-52]
MLSRGIIPKTIEKAIHPRRLFIVHLVTTVYKIRLLMQKIKKNGQNILLGKIFRINRWPLLSDIEIRQ